MAQTLGEKKNAAIKEEIVGLIYDCCYKLLLKRNKLNPYPLSQTSCPYKLNNPPHPDLNTAPH